MDNTKTDSEVKKCDEGCCCGHKSEQRNPFTETLKSGMSKVFGGAKTAMISVAALAIAMTGCRTLPTVDKMETVASLIGTSAGMVVNMTKIDAKSKSVVIEIMKIAEDSVPQTNQTFVAAWTPIAKEHIGRLVDGGTLDALQGQLVLTGFGLACDGLDYIFEVRYPKARDYKELVDAAVHGFIGGFTSVVNVETVKSPFALPPYDTDALNELCSKLR